MAGSPVETEGTANSGGLSAGTMSARSKAGLPQSTTDSPSIKQMRPRVECLFQGEIMVPMKWVVFPLQALPQLLASAKQGLPDGGVPRQQAPRGLRYGLR